jgi:hypothetical protein
MPGRDPSRSALSGRPTAEAPLRALTRRGFVAVAAGSVAASSLHAAAQSTPETEQPVATPSGEIRIDSEQLARVSLALMGGGTLNDPGIETLAGLISANEQGVRAFDELAHLDDPSSEEALDKMSPNARDLVENIVQFWFMGQFDGNPVENRADLYFALPVWETVPYFAQPTLCKAFGYWALEVSLGQ